MYTATDRMISELCHAMNSRGGGLAVLYCPGENVETREEIPHNWQCVAEYGTSPRDKLSYTGYGVTMPAAVTECYQNFQDQNVHQHRH